MSASAVEDISKSKADERITLCETGVVDLEGQKMPESKTNSTNPVDDQSFCFEKKDQSSIISALTEPTGLSVDQDPECQPFERDQDSVNSMLEMMDTKGESKNRSQPSQQTKTGQSPKKWSMPSLLGEINNGDADGDDHSSDSASSYDCIALSSLREKVKNCDDQNESNPKDDEESLRYDPKSPQGGDGKSQASTVTISDESHELIHESYSRRHYGGKYTAALACFLALVLMVGIGVLSYSLYAVRQREEIEEETTGFTSEFWNEMVPKAPAFGK